MASISIVKSCYEEVRDNLENLRDDHDSPDTIKSIAATIYTQLQEIRSTLPELKNPDKWTKDTQKITVEVLSCMNEIANSSLEKMDNDGAGTSNATRLKKRVNRVLKAYDGITNIVKILEGSSKSTWKSKHTLLQKKSIELFDEFTRINLDKIEGDGKKNRKKDAELKEPHLSSRIRKIDERIAKIQALLKGSQHLAKTSRNSEYASRLNDAQEERQSLIRLREQAVDNNA